MLGKKPSGPVSGQPAEDDYNNINEDTAIDPDFDEETARQAKMAFHAHTDDDQMFGFRKAFNPNATETNALLSITQTEFEIYL